MSETVYDGDKCFNCGEHQMPKWRKEETSTTARRCSMCGAVEERYKAQMSDFFPDETPPPPPAKTMVQKTMEMFSKLPRHIPRPAPREKSNENL